MDNWLVIETLVNCFDVAFVILVLNFQLGIKESTKHIHIFLFSVFALVTSVIFNHLTGQNVSIALYVLVLFFVYAYLFLEHSLRYKAFWVLVIMTLKYCVAMLLVLILNAFSKNLSFSILESQNAYRLVFICVLVVIQMLMLIPLLKIKFHFDQAKEPILLLSTIALLLTYLFLVFVQLFNIVGRGVTLNIFLITTIVFFFINIVNMYITYAAHKKHRHILEQELKIQQMELKLKSQDELLSTVNKFKYYQENVTNSLQTIWAIAKKHKVPELDRCLEEFANINFQFDKLFDTGNDVVNAVLDGKDVVAKDANINFIVKCDSLEDIPFDSIDIGNILIHTLDNAIEAVSQLEEGVERVIELYIEVTERDLSILIENPVGQNESRNSTELYRLSSPHNSGIGLKITKEIVDKYKGSLLISNEEFYFKVLVQLPFLK